MLLILNHAARFLQPLGTGVLAQHTAALHTFLKSVDVGLSTGLVLVESQSEDVKQKLNIFRPHDWGFEDR